MAATSVMTGLMKQLKVPQTQAEEAADQLAGVRTTSLLRYDAPIQRAGVAAASREPPIEDEDFTPGFLRVRILEADGLPNRPDGSCCQPYVTVANTQLTGRRVRRTDAANGPCAVWGQSFDFDDTSASAQVVIDVWDKASDAPAPDLLGKAVIHVSECRPGIPHTFLNHLLLGKLAVRLLFDYAPLPETEPHDLELARIIGLGAR